MTWLNVKGVKRVVAKGRAYYYHRRTMQRIWTDPEADPAAFAAEVQKLDAGAPVLPKPLDKPRTLEELVVRYRSSPELIEQSKTGRVLTVLRARRLRVVLDLPDASAPDDVKVPTIARRQDGRPYTKDGLDTLFDRLKRKLVKDGKIRAGLTFHGLRKSLAKKAADLGFSESDIAGALGNASAASARPYTIEAARDKGARRVFKALKKRR